MKRVDADLLDKFDITLPNITGAEDPGSDLAQAEATCSKGVEQVLNNEVFDPPHVPTHPTEKIIKHEELHGDIGSLN